MEPNLFLLFLVNIDIFLVSEPLLKKVSLSHLRLEVAELGFSLKDFQKSLWITIKYTKMRKQFRTIEGSKD